VATRIRPFRNTDPPALADLWNRALPAFGVVRPLNAHELDALVFARVGFDREGFLVAERDGVPVGFAHAGFGPAQPEGPSHRLDATLGTIAMLAVAPGVDDPELEAGLVAGAEAHLRARGAQVLYAGGQDPLNPFYWGLYGGSEFAGVLGGHAAFHRAVGAAGYQPVARIAILERDLDAPEPPDPRLASWAARARVEFLEDALPEGWWQALAIGPFRPTRVRVIDPQDGTALARATTWEIAGGVDTGDGRSRTGVFGVEVHPAHRRRGLGRFLLAAIAREARRQFADRLTIQTPETNTAALGLYAGAGFARAETATLYRKPG
jgi:ribosomal protein S18 acetylase RimI-like enzyme